MAIFHVNPGGVRHLVLQDAEKVWALAEDGVIAVEGALADRFRKVAADYGYVEQKPPAKPAPVKADPKHAK